MNSNTPTLFDSLEATTFGPLETSPRVIALNGAAGSGKSTAADYLVKRGFVRIKFAGPLKDMCRAIGMTEAQIEGNQKQVPTRLLQGKTPREFMQLLGTEFGRDLIGRNFWTDLWLASAREVLEEGGRVVVDDCRFPNEAEAIRSIGGVIYRLVGRGGIEGGHSSEGQSFPVDGTIHNVGSKLDLFRDIDRLRGVAGADPEGVWTPFASGRVA